MEPDARYGRAEKYRYDGKLKDRSDSWNSRNEEKKEVEKPVEKERPNFEPTGILKKDPSYKRAMEKQKVIVGCKWNPPSDAVNVKDGLYALTPFSGDDPLPIVFLDNALHRGSQKSYFLFGKDERVADVVLTDDSCSNQHAVIQFRGIEFELEKEQDSGRDGSKGKRKRKRKSAKMVTKIVPYLVDLESKGKTWLNGKAIEPARMVRLYSKDLVRFGNDPVEYVVLRQ